MPSSTLLDEATRNKLRALWNAFMVFVALGLTAALSTLVYIAVQNNHNGNLLVDCTTPGHGCYEQARQQTGEAISSINDVTVAANFCALRFAPGPLTDNDFEKFTACVKDHVKIVPN